jgi:hypothetical protein
LVVAEQPPGFVLNDFGVEECHNTVWGKIELLQALQGKARVGSVQLLPVSCPKTEQERQACPRLASNPAKSTGAAVAAPGVGYRMPWKADALVPDVVTKVLTGDADGA